MLYLNPPYHSIDGVTLLPDHADPLQFYFMPMSPYLSTIQESGLHIPKIQLIKYAGTSSTSGEQISGGFVDFDTNLGIEPDRLAEIATLLRGEAQLSAMPRLTPVPLIDGSVRMMLFGAETPEDETGLTGRPTGNNEPREFVLKISHHGKPSLYGDNQAAFSVRLDQEGVTILEQALQGEMAPIGVIYSLSYVGLRKAYNVRVDVDWDRVQTHIEENEKVNVPLIASSEVIDVVDELVEEQIINIESDLLIAADDDDSGATGRYEAALNQVRAMVFENFFEPSLEPMPRETDGDIVDDLSRVHNAAVTGGFPPVWGRKKVDLTRVDNKKLNIDMSERTSVVRQIHPQGHLTGIARTIADQGLDLNRFIISVPLDDDFFARRTMRVIPRADFATDEIQSINVTLEYDGDAQNVVFDATATEQTVSWPSSLDGGRMRADVTVSYEVTFASSVTGRPRSIISTPEVVRGDVVEIAPRADIPYEIRWVSFNVIDFPWDIYHTAEVHCTYIDEANGIDIRNQYGLNATTAAGAAWPIFALDSAQRTIRYRLIHHGHDGRDWSSDWLETEDEQIRIADPFSNRRSLSIVAPSALFGTQLDRAFVDVSYEDPVNGVSKRESFELSATDAATKQFLVELVDPTLRTVSFKITMILIDGTVVDVPLSSTELERIFITPQMRGHRTVRIAANPGGFASGELTSVRVETTYDRPEAGLRSAGDVTLSAATPNATFEYDFASGDDQYTYRITHRFGNGLTRDSGWLTSAAPTITADAA